MTTKFYFTPLKKRVKIEKELTVSVLKRGIYLSRQTLITLGNFGEPFHIFLYEDIAKKALAFQIKRIEGPLIRDSNKRLITPIKTNNTKSFHAFVGIKPFLELLPDIKIPQKNLPLKKYNDTSFSGAGEVYYFQLKTLK